MNRSIQSKDRVSSKRCHQASVPVRGSMVAWQPPGGSSPALTIMSPQATTSGCSDCLSLLMARAPLCTIKLWMPHSGNVDGLRYV
ncbi:hypothetical protein OEZ86_005125 [Tetradesmus obliquus]|nr:hypothetical protein OEZ86_005125 [Tetradesmus obliquus]